MIILDLWFNLEKTLRKRVFILTGAPGVGKTTVLLKTGEVLKANGVSVGGMVSREARQDGVRVGFEILDLATGKKGWLAHVKQTSGPQVGKYRVNLDDLQIIGARSIIEACEKCDVVAIDEIGPMELFSSKFKEAVELAMESKKPVLAVVHAKATNDLIIKAKSRKDAQIFTVIPVNRDKLPEELSRQIQATLNG